MKRLGVALGWIATFGGVGVLVSVGLLVAAGGGTWSAPAMQGWDFAVQSVCGLGGFVVATWLVGVRAARHTWAELGWHREGGGGLSGRLLRGIGIGVAMAALAVGLAALGGARVYREQPVGYLDAAAPLLVGLLAAALLEELLFRGFPLRRLADALGPWTATGLFAAVFGVAHLGNPGATAIAAVNIALAGVWLAVAFFSAGGMALAWGLHFGWNAGLALGFDAPVSGVAFDVPALAYAAGPRAWLDGGGFGPEGGLIGTIVVVMGTAAVLGRRLRRPREWLAA